MWGSVPETNSNHQQCQTPCFMAPDIIQADMNHADPNTMRARARQATEILKTQLLGTGTIEPLVALYFDDHIEQVEFQDPSVLEHFDVRTARSFDYLRTLVRIKNPQAAMITLDVRISSSDDSGSSALQTFWREDRRVKCSLRGDARRRGRYTVPAFQDFLGCICGRVLNGLIAYCYDDDSAIAQTTCSLNRLITRSAPSTVLSRFSACLIASNSTEVSCLRMPDRTAFRNSSPQPARSSCH